MPRIRPVTLVLIVAVAGPAAAQTTYDACYVPTVGAIYLIKQAGLPNACLGQTHVAFSWSQGGGTLDHGALTGLTDDDHPQYLVTNGVRNATSGFAVTGTILTGTIPASGDGVRLMWYPAKAAFRAGRAASGGWDDASIGRYSSALGVSTTASGDAATALGSGTTASGQESIAMGHSTTASGTYSAAWGSSTTATGSVATAMGVGTTAQSVSSLAIGDYNIIAGSPTVIVPTDPLFVAGNGADAGTRSNALTLLKNGNLTIAGTLTQSSDIRFKEGIRTMDRALDGVLDLRPIYYRFRAGTGHPTDEQIGLAAQEVERVFPQLVHRDSEGKLSVAYTQLAAVLVRAAQEQQAIIESLRAELAALRATMEANGMKK